VGTIHGGLYIIYLLVAFPLSRRLRLTAGPTVALLLAGTIPVMTFIVERWISHRYIEPALAGQAAGHAVRSRADAIESGSGSGLGSSQPG
jgi:Domain of unknown function (DUF3817)